MRIRLVAEIGATHLSSIDRAKMLIKLASKAGADYVKLQKRNPVESVPLELHNKPHPNPAFAYGKTYLEHRQVLELSIEQHRELKAFCEQDANIGYSTSVWDITSAREVISLNPEFIKVPSACNNHYKMLDILFDEYSGGIHISTGMTTRQELLDLHEYIHNKDKSCRAVIYHSTTEYPCSHERLFLNEILTCKQLFNPRQVGFSNHGYGISMDLIAVTLGATWIERHFIDDRTFRHTDASASLEPSGLEKLSRDLKAATLALQYKESLTAEEMNQRIKMKYRKADV